MKKFILFFLLAGASQIKAPEIDFLGGLARVQTRSEALAIINRVTTAGIEEALAQLQAQNREWLDARQRSMGPREAIGRSPFDWHISLLQEVLDDREGETVRRQHVEFLRQQEEIRRQRQHADEQRRLEELEEARNRAAGVTLIQAIKSTEGPLVIKNLAERASFIELRQALSEQVSQEVRSILEQAIERWALQNYVASARNMYNSSPADVERILNAGAATQAEIQEAYDGIQRVSPARMGGSEEHIAQLTRDIERVKELLAAALATTR